MASYARKNSQIRKLLSVNDGWEVMRCVVSRLLSEPLSLRIRSAWHGARALWLQKRRADRGSRARGDSANYYKSIMTSRFLSYVEHPVDMRWTDADEQL